jgi:hypothetical protein
LGVGVSGAEVRESLFLYLTFPFGDAAQRQNIIKGGTVIFQTEVSRGIGSDVSEVTIIHRKAIPRFHLEVKNFNKKVSYG